MAALTAEKRKKIPTSEFGLPGRQYPLDTTDRAKSALRFIGRYGTAAQKRTIQNKVKRKYPGINVTRAGSNMNTRNMADMENAIVRELARRSQPGLDTNSSTNPFAQQLLKLMGLDMGGSAEQNNATNVNPSTRTISGVTGAHMRMPLHPKYPDSVAFTMNGQTGRRWRGARMPIPGMKSRMPKGKGL